jgi:hypothetical protein
MSRSTREMILASWHAARRKADVTGAVTLTAAGFAGYALEQAAGDAERAQDAVPLELEVFWSRVRDALQQVVSEERPLRAVGGDVR